MWRSELGKVTANAHFLGGDHQVIAVASTITQRAPVMNANPVASRLAADIARTSVGVHEKAMIGRDHHLMKATLFQLMNCDPNAFECIGNLCRGGVRMVLKVAIYLYSAQHQQIGFRREIETSANKVFQTPLFKALAVFLPKHIHALRNGFHHLVTQHWHQTLFVILDAKLLASPGQQAGHTYWRDAW